MKSKTLIFLVITAVIFVISSFVQAGVPQLISYQGILTDDSGEPLTGNFIMTFSIYADEVGGSPLWSENKAVDVTEGLLSTNLGTNTELTESVFSDSARYLGIKVESDPEMPRSRMTSSPYAYRIATVDGSISKLLILEDSGSTRVELGVGTEILRVYDSDGWLRVRMSIDSSGLAKEGSGIDGGGAISFFPQGAFSKDGSGKVTEDNLTSGSLVRIGESAQGTGEINIFDTSGNELARMTSTDVDGGAFYTYYDDGTRLSYQGQSSDTGGFISTYGTNGKRSATLSSLVGTPGNGFIAVYDSTIGGGLRVGMFSDYGHDGHFFTRNRTGQTSVEMSNLGDTAIIGGGFVHVFGPNGKLNVGLWNLNGHDNNGFIDVFDSLGQNQAGMYVDTLGNGIVFGDTKSFRMANPKQPGTELWYTSLEGPEAGAYTRGTEKLVNGRAIVYFPEHFETVASPEGMTVQIVPLSADSRGLAVVEKHSDHIVVQELMNGTGNYSFDYTVTAVRKGYEDYQVVHKVMEREPDFKSVNKRMPIQANARSSQFK